MTLLQTGVIKIKQPGSDKEKRVLIVEDTWITGKLVYHSHGMTKTKRLSLSEYIGELKFTFFQVHVFSVPKQMVGQPVVYMISPIASINSKQLSVCHK